MKCSRPINRLMRLLGAMLLLSLTSCGDSAPAQPSVPREIPRGAVLRLPSQGIYTGAYVEFGDKEDQVTLEGIDRFEAMVGRHQAIIASSSYWGERSFPARNIELMARHKALPLIFWSPWTSPYEEDRGPDEARLENILDGRWDAYIDMWADGARAYDRPLLVSWGLEMNGSWFPWSGCFYNPKPHPADKHPPDHPGPELYKRTYRYVVDRVRARGARKIQWVFHANNFSFPDEPWNQMSRYYPGADYVDWLGLSAYGKLFPGDPWRRFTQVMDEPYRQLCLLDPAKPVIMAEWGVGEFPDTGNKAEFIRDAFKGFKTSYPRLKAAVFWHERWENKDETYSNLRVNSSPEALAVFRESLSDPFFLDYPLMAGDAEPKR